MKCTLSQSYFTASALIVFTLFLGACDKRSAEEKGRDFAEEKVGFVEGAAQVLKEKSKKIGESAGQGIGDLVKGTGSGFKDVVNPPVKAVPGASLAQSGIKVLRAHEGKGTDTIRRIVVAAAFDGAYTGRLLLKALDAEGNERGRSQPTPNVNQAAGSTSDIEFVFSGSLRLSKIVQYEVIGLAAKKATLSGALGTSGIKLSQLKEKGHQVTLYLQFMTPYSGSLHLRAQNSNGEELGRSRTTGPLAQVADSASHMVFTFDQNTPMSEVGGYVLHGLKPQGAQ